MDEYPYVYSDNALGIEAHLMLKCPLYVSISESNWLYVVIFHFFN